MKITLIGHASLLLETNELTCIMDPVFFDPFEDGAVTSCPKRVVDVNQIPSIDIIIISHQHPDHFDLLSLQHLSRSATIMCPNDKLIVSILHKMGFYSIITMNSNKPVTIKDTLFLPTPSVATNIVEFGMIFKTNSACCWNQVDSDCPINQIRNLLEQSGHIDFLIARYASQNFDFFEHRVTTFPYQEYSNCLAKVVETNPTMVVPGASGFRFCEPHDWLNQFLFPISENKFIRDIETILPNVKVSDFKPGDIVEIRNNEVRHNRGMSTFVKMISDDVVKIKFNPTGHIPPIVDYNPFNHSIAYIEKEVERIIERDIISFLNLTQTRDMLEFSPFYELNACYQFVVIWPHKNSSFFNIVFNHKSVKFYEDKNRFPDGGHYIAATALIDWWNLKSSSFYIRAYSRHYNHLSRIEIENNSLTNVPISNINLLSLIIKAIKSKGIA